MLIKIVLTVLAFQNPATLALTILYPLITVGIVAVSIFITLAFLPNKLYQAAARPFEFLDKLLALYELKSLQNRLDPLCPPVVTGRLRLKDVLGDLDYHLYRALIAIWDAKKTLSGYAGLTHDLTLLPVTAIHSPGRNLPEWDTQKLQHARLLHISLQTVDDEQPFTALVKSYQHVSRTVRRKMGVNFSLGGTALDVAYQN